MIANNPVPIARPLAVALVLACVKLSLAQVETTSLPAPQACVLLKNDQVLIGTAEQQGEFVIVRRSAGNEIRLPRSQVACWANSMRALYRYRVDHRQDNLSGRIKDADWCLQYQLYDLADREIRALVELAPGNPSVKRLQQELRFAQRSEADDPPLEHPVRPDWQGTSPPTATTRDEKRKGRQSFAGVGGSSATASSAMPIGARDLQLFAGHVQPLLFNRCGRCHDAASGREWRLLVPPTGTRASSRMTHVNLTATLPFVELAMPEESPLVQMAITAHGRGPAPLGPRQTKSIAALKAWVQQLGSPTGSPMTPTANAMPVAWNAPIPGSPTPGSPTPVSSPPDTARPSIESPSDFDRWLQNQSTKKHAPARLPTVANPFDPDLFNRRFHK